MNAQGTVVVGCCVGDEAILDRYLRRSMGDARLITRHHQSSIFAAYNSILDEVRDGVAVVLAHDDVEVRDRGLASKLEELFRDPDIAVVGCVGATEVQSIAWWEGKKRGRVTETRGLMDFGGGTHDVEAVDGSLIALSPWAVKNLRFDTTTFSGFHAYDVDICFQALALGKRVVVSEFDVIHHTKATLGDEIAFRTADLAWQRKWRRARRWVLVVRYVKLAVARRRANGMTIHHRH